MSYDGIDIHALLRWAAVGEEGAFEALKYRLPAAVNNAARLDGPSITSLLARYDLGVGSAERG